MDSCPPSFGTQAPPKRQPRATQKQHAIACTRANSKNHPLEIAYGFLPSPLWHPSTTQEVAKAPIGGAQKHQDCPREALNKDCAGGRLVSRQGPQQKLKNKKK